MTLRWIGHQTVREHEHGSERSGSRRRPRWYSVGKSRISSVVIVSSYL
jgi:hypothetical protein